MLPYLPKAKSAGFVMVEHRKPDEKPEESHDDAGLKAAARDLIDAIKSDDIARAAEAIKAAFYICDSMPHHEGPHEE